MNPATNTEPGAGVADRAPRRVAGGDEFEGGQGKLVFDRFAAMGGTRYRSGDPYAGELVAMEAETVQQSTASSEKFNEFRDQLTDIESAHRTSIGACSASWKACFRCVLPVPEVPRNRTVSP